MVWWDESRIKYSEASSEQQELATAVGMLVWSEQLTDLGGPCPNPDTGAASTAPYSLLHTRQRSFVRAARCRCVTTDSSRRGSTRSML